MDESITYQIKNEDLYECWNFSVKYFLNPSKGVNDRTNYMKRGLGGIFDSFTKKIHEIAIREIIKEKSINGINPKTDFIIHKVGETQKNNLTEPDIITVYRKDFSESDLELLHKTMHTIEQEKKVLKAKEAELKKARGFQKLIKDCSNENEKKDVRKKTSEYKSNKDSIRIEFDDLDKKLKNVKNDIKKFEIMIKPKIYVEIKNVGDSDEWIGPKVSEIESITGRSDPDMKKGSESNPTWKENKVYYVYCNLKSRTWKDEDSKKQNRNTDLLGVFLKQFKINDEMNAFHDVDELYIEIKHVMSVADMKKDWTLFPNNIIMPMPPFFTRNGEINFANVSTPYSEKQIKENIDNEIYEKVELIERKLPKETASKIKVGTENRWALWPEALGDFVVNGNVEVYKEELASTRRFWIKCNSAVKIENKVMGTTKMKKDEIWCYQVGSSMRGTKKSSDYWISVRNEKIMKKFKPEKIFDIVNNI
jgi:hypothetical protein